MNDQEDEAAVMDRITANNEAYRLGCMSGIDKHEECEEMRMLIDAMPENRDKLVFWFEFGRRETLRIAEGAIESETLDEVNARRGHA